MQLNEIRELIWQTLLESEIIPVMFAATCVIEVSRQENLTDILTAIRSLKGVTVVTMIEPHANVSSDKQKAIIMIKFIPTQGLPLKNYLHSLKSSATNIPGVYSLKVKKAEPMKTDR